MHYLPIMSLQCILQPYNQMTSAEAKDLIINGWPRAGILEAVPTGKERSYPIRLIS